MAVEERSGLPLNVAALPVKCGPYVRTPSPLSSTPNLSVALRGLQTRYMFSKKLLVLPVAPLATRLSENIAALK